MSDPTTSDSTASEHERNGWLRVAGLGEVQPGTLRSVTAGGTDLVLANVDGEVYALEDMCSHEEYPLSDGDLEGTEVECMLHGARFDVCTGRATRLPAVRPVKSYDVEIRDGDIYIRLG